MRPLLLLLSSLTICGGLARAQTSAAAPAGGVRAIFDGRTLAGWEGDARYWTVEEGAITGRTTAQQPLEGTTYLVWRGGEPADFELELECKLEGGNSGVQFRSRDAGPHQVEGLQADLEDGPDWTGCLYEQGGRGVLVRRGQELHCAADGTREPRSIGDPAELLRAAPAGAWNALRIRARGPRVEYEINGRLMCALEDRDPRHFRASGLIALQLHQGGPMQVRFRKLSLKELPASTQADAAPAVPAKPARALPQWIWSHAGAGEDERACLRREFELPAVPTRSHLLVSADNHARIHFNGQEIGECDDWMVGVEFDLTKLLRPGRNAIALDCRNAGGPAAVIAELTDELAGDEHALLVSDASWSAGASPAEGWDEPGFRAEGWHAAHALGHLGTAPWGWLGIFGDEPGQQALAGADVVVPAGFEVELVYSVPRSRQGSWISLAVDPKGRFYASDQYGSIWRTTLAARKGDVPLVERVEAPVGEAHGLLWAFDSLYAVVSSGGKYASGLWRLTDADGDDRLERAELLTPIDGNGEHGPHAVLLGPDGQSLYVMCGNHVTLPDDFERYRVPPTWGEDQLLEHRDDPKGHAVGVMAPGGWLMRGDRDGKHWELFAAGMRNAYDACFDADGECFTFDSDMEWDLGLPWYKPTRILHLVSGVDYGWRNGNANWPAWVPDALPAVVDVGVGSPTGMLSGHRTSFPEPYRSAIYAADWAYGRILAVHLEPRGASYTGSFEVFASGKPLPVTDMEVGPDGALYFATGGRGTQSGLYRIEWKEGSAKPQTWRPPPVLCAGLDTSEVMRLIMEVSQNPGHEKELKSIELGLESADAFVRAAARAALEQQDPKRWQENALRQQAPRALVQAMIALVHVQPPGIAPAVYERLLQVDLDRLEPSLRADFLRVISLALTRLDAPQEPQHGALVARLDALFPCGDDRCDRLLCELLVALRAPSVVAKGIERLDQAKTQEEQLHYAFTLANVKEGWTLDERRRFFTWYRGRASSFVGGESFRLFLEGMHEDVLARMSPAEHAALDPWLASTAAQPAPAAPAETLIAYAPAHPWTLAELAPALPEVKRGRSFEQGQAAYARTNCATCHRIGNEGGSSGPDLTGAGNRFSARDLLEATLEPSRVISDQYRDTEIVTTDEELLVGRVESEKGGVLRLHIVGTPERTVEIALADIALRRPARLSRMPTGLVDTLSREQVLDLLAYLIAAGRADDPAFR